MALELLARYKLPIEGLSSKSWDEFAATGPGAPAMNFVFTVCDNAAGEICPVWPGRPITAHWPITDPAVATEPEQAHAFREALTLLENRIKIFTSLPIAALDRIALQKRLDGIGRLEAETNA